MVMRWSKLIRRPSHTRILHIASPFGLHFGINITQWSKALCADFKLKWYLSTFKTCQGKTVYLLRHMAASNKVSYPFKSNNGSCPLGITSYSQNLGSKQVSPCHCANWWWVCSHGILSPLNLLCQRFWCMDIRPFIFYFLKFSWK